MASCKTDFLYYLSPLQIGGKSLIIQKWIKSPIKKLCRVIVSRPLVLTLTQGWLYTARLTFVWERLDLWQRTYVGFSQWAATCNTKSFNIHASANNFFFLWPEFSLWLLNLYYFVCFNSWEILFASLTSRFFLRNCKKHNWQNLRSLKLRTNKVYTCI